ncbi:MAG: class I SAM-dependent methyltransferase [bacterium]|nr:class I SAM-dependent methyltransferase [bacterium]
MAVDFKQYYTEEWKTKLSQPQYQELSSRWRSRWDFAKKYAPVNGKVLDVGCGDGILGQVLIRDLHCQVHGIDISDYALDLASQRGIMTAYCDMSGDRFPFVDNTFDYAVLACTLEHIMDPLHALAETRRVLKPGGLMAVSLPNVAYFWNRVWFVLGRTSKDFLHVNPGEGMHLQFYNYKNEFEERVLKSLAHLTVIRKQGDLKNPRKYTPFGRALLRFGIAVTPNLFAQYTHWLIRKES